MSVPQEPLPGKLVVSLLMRNEALAGPVADRLCDRFGPPDAVSPWLTFEYTRYYEKEMGAGLKRRLLSFAGLIPQNSLAKIKTATNRIEDQYVDDESRRVNIDPGCLSAERLVLATGKNFTHRIYLDLGIYADLTLIFTKGDFSPLPWTYPDYADEGIKSFLRLVRKKYLQDIKSVR